MDIYTAAFAYPRRARANADASGAPAAPPEPLQPADAEALQKLAVRAMALQGVHVAYAPAEHGGGWHFLVSGPMAPLLAARGMLLKDCPAPARAAVRVARSDVLDFPASKPALKADVRRRLDEIAGGTGAHIAVVNSPLAFSSRAPPDGVSSAAGWSGLETERVCELVVTGQADAVARARVRLLVMLDELAGLHADCCEVDQKLQAIVAGRKRGVLQGIQEETGTNVYLPSPLQGLVGPDAAQGSPARAARNSIWITGEFFGVQRARDMLLQFALSKSKAVVSRDTAILPRKLDWMVLERSEDLKAIMNDNGTFISFPPLGSSTSLITVFGDHKVHVQRTIRAVMQLACQFYVASFWLLPAQFNPLLPPPALSPAQATAVLKQVAGATGAEVVFKTMNFEMYGLEHEVRAAITMLLDIDALKAFHHEIRLQIELANEHREFISGKKNGKINKIMQTTGVKIKFETFNDHNFLIDMAGTDGTILAGLALLQEELPAEISFHVPEAYHKRIIGVGGRSIQRIMKKYGVYVKFSNAEEFAALGGYGDNDDNVVARTPAKNAINLDNLRQAVMELVNPKDKDYMPETVVIPRRYHRTLLGEKSIFIHDIENKTNCRIRFPDKESASDAVTIFGPESQLQIAATMLLDHVPFEADLLVPPQSELRALAASADFTAFAEQVKRDLHVAIFPALKPGGDATPTEAAFRFRCQRSNADVLGPARELLERFLREHGALVYPAPAPPPAAHKRGDSFARAFPHFDSKVLSTMPRARGSADFSRPDPMADRRLRMANSSPDVKALFNNGAHAPHAQTPPYIYHLDEARESLESQHSYLAPAAPADYWAPQQPRGHARFLSMSHADEGAPPPLPPADDGAGAGAPQRLGQPRGLAHRAQSLDLTYSLARIQEQRGGVPPSPTHSAGERSASPASATAPSFPSVYAPTGAGRTPIGAHRGVRSLDAQGVEEVARVMSGLGL